jgi:hypothetical protein
MTISERFIFREIPCPVCGGNDSRFIGLRGGRVHQNGAGIACSIVRCRECSHQFLNPMPFPSGTSSEVYSDAEHYFHGHDLEIKKGSSLSAMKDFELRLKKKGRFLDVGCGMGALLWAARQSGWDAVGVDRARFQLLDLRVSGELSEQQGSPSLRKTVEFAGAKALNAIGRRLNMGSYMGIWARKPSEDM